MTDVNEYHHHINLLIILFVVNLLNTVSSFSLFVFDSMFFKRRSQPQVPQFHILDVGYLEKHFPMWYLIMRFLIALFS